MDMVEHSIEKLMFWLHTNYGWFSTEDLENTPARVARCYAEWQDNQAFEFTTFDADPDDDKTAYIAKLDDLIILRGIRFYSLCSHHLLPYYGTIDIAYLPYGRICGISKLARAAQAVASKPSVQEKITQELADMIMSKLGARFVMVIVRAAHLCMLMRGIKQAGSEMVTSAIRKDNAIVIKDWESLKEEATRLMT